MLGLDQTWQWAIIWPSLFLVALGVLANKLQNQKEVYEPKHSVNRPIDTSSLVWDNFIMLIFGPERVINGRENVWSQAGSISNWDRCEDITEVLPIQLELV